MASTMSLMDSLSQPDRFVYTPELGFRVVIPIGIQTVSHQRATTAQLRALLLPEIRLTRGGNVSARQSSLPPEQPYSWYLAQLIHWGLQFCFGKEDAVQLLTRALAESCLRVPWSLIDLEKSLKRSYRRSAKRKFQNDEDTTIDVPVKRGRTVHEKDEESTSASGSDTEDTSSEDTSSDGSGDSDEEAQTAEIPVKTEPAKTAVSGIIKHGKTIWEKPAATDPSDVDIDDASSASSSDEESDEGNVMLVDRHDADDEDSSSESSDDSSDESSSETSLDSNSHSNFESKLKEEPDTDSESDEVRLTPLQKLRIVTDSAKKNKHVADSPKSKSSHAITDTKVLNRHSGIMQKSPLVESAESAKRKPSTSSTDNGSRKRGAFDASKSATRAVPSDVSSMEIREIPQPPKNATSISQRVPVAENPTRLGNDEPGLGKHVGSLEQDLDDIQDFLDVQKKFEKDMKAAVASNPNPWMKTAAAASKSGGNKSSLALTKRPDITVISGGVFSGERSAPSPQFAPSKSFGKSKTLETKPSWASTQTSLPEEPRSLGTVGLSQAKRRRLSHQPPSGNETMNSGLTFLSTGSPAMPTDMRRSPGVNRADSTAERKLKVAASRPILPTKHSFTPSRTTPSTSTAGSSIGWNSDRVIGHGAIRTPSSLAQGHRRNRDLVWPSTRVPQTQPIPRHIKFEGSPETNFNPHQSSEAGSRKSSAEVKKNLKIGLSRQHLGTGFSGRGMFSASPKSRRRMGGLIAAGDII